MLSYYIKQYEKQLKQNINSLYSYPMKIYYIFSVVNILNNLKNTFKI